MPPSIGQIDVEMGEKFLADHWDTYEKKEDRNLRPLCGHGDTSLTGEPVWVEPPYSPMGAVTAQRQALSLAKERLCSTSCFPPPTT